MPYKDSERKRQWEREHREQRNARRRTLRLTAQTVVIPKAPDPIANQRPPSGRGVLAVLGVGFGIVLALALAGAGLPFLPGSDPIGPSR